MCMGIFKARHQKITATVYFPVPFHAGNAKFLTGHVRSLFITHINNPVIPDPDFPGEEIFPFLHSKDPGIV